MKNNFLNLMYGLFAVVGGGVSVLVLEPIKAMAIIAFLILVFYALAYINMNKFSYETDVSYKINVVKVRENATIPTRGSEDAAGFDLYACIDTPITIKPHETAMVPTGVAMELPKNTFAAIYARSGLASKRGLRPANCVGVCDSDYRGEYMVALHNDSEVEATIEPNERIAQMVVERYEKIKFNEVDKLEDTKRGAGGFGSTGK